MVDHELFLNLRSKEKQNPIKLLTYLEETYTCSGFCTQGFFTLSQDVSKPVVVNCLDVLMIEIRQVCLLTGILLIITGMLSLVVWFAQYCLWKWQFKDNIIDPSKQSKI